MEILVEKREELLTAGYVVFWKIVPVSHGRQSSYNLFPTIDRNAEILSTGFNDRFSRYSHRIPALIFEEIILRKFSCMPKLETFLNHKAKIIFGIALAFPSKDLQLYNNTSRCRVPRHNVLFTTVFVNTWLCKTKHPRKRFENSVSLASYWQIGSKSTNCSH